MIHIYIYIYIYTYICKCMCVCVISLISKAIAHFFPPRIIFLMASGLMVGGINKSESLLLLPWGVDTISCQEFQLSLAVFFVLFCF